MSNNKNFGFPLHEKSSFRYLSHSNENKFNILSSNNNHLTKGKGKKEQTISENNNYQYTHGYMPMPMYYYPPYEHTNFQGQGQGYTIMQHPYYYQQTNYGVQQPETEGTQDVSGKNKKSHNEVNSYQYRTDVVINI